jgi:hypothetical protein
VVGTSQETTRHLVAYRKGSEVPVHGKAQRHKEEGSSVSFPIGNSVSENEIAKGVVDAAFKIHSTLGPGLLESVYEVILVHELQSRGFVVERQKPIPLVLTKSASRKVFALTLL